MEDISYNSIDEIEELILLASEIFISSPETNAIIYCAGYVAWKIIERLKCDCCRQLLILNVEIDAKFSSETEYLRGLDRSGLKYPSDISTELGVRSL